MRKTSLTLALLSVLSSSVAAQDRFIFRATPGVLGVVGEPRQPQPEPPQEVQDTIAPVFTTTLLGDLWVIEAVTTESASVVAADDSGEVFYAVEAGPPWLSYEAGVLTASPPRGATFDRSVSLKAADPSGNTASYSF